MQAQLQLLDSLINQYPQLFLAFTVWTLVWKAIALWMASRKNQSWWFILMLVLNTVGILEILYIFFLNKLVFIPAEPISLEKAKQMGEKLKIDWSKFDPEQFHQGMLVELEHGRRESLTNVTNDDLEMTAKIALAHLREYPDYYVRLDKMEKEAEAYWQKNGD